MSWSLQITSSAEKEIRKLPVKIMQRVYNKIRALAENPFQPQVEKLKGFEGYRFRIGDYRILFDRIPMRR